MIPNITDSKVVAALDSGDDPMVISERILKRAKDIIMMGAGSRDQSYKNKIANLPSVDEIFQDVTVWVKKK